MDFNMPSGFRKKIEDQEFIFPVFKFLSHNHAQSLINDGNVHLPTLHEFRDDKAYKGKILDTEEGKIQLLNYYDCYEGLAKNADGALPLFFPPYHKISALQNNFQQHLEASNIYIYCVTRFLFSDSLKWAAEEKKDTCVLITDFEKLLSHVTSNLEDVKFHSVGECKYLGRTIEENNPGPQSLTNYFLANNHQIAYLKPKEYKEQREIRAIWYSDSKEKVAPITKNIENVNSLTIPVDISGINFDEIKEGKIKLGARIHKRDKKEPAEYVIEKPFGFCTPVIFRNKEGPWYLGFMYPGNPKHVENGHFKYASIGISDSRLGLIFCCVELENVESIEFIQLENT